MTTKFKSFDASPLRAFVQSPLGARNKPERGIVIVVAWMLSNKSGRIYTAPLPGQPVIWPFDLAGWLRAVSERDPAKFRAILFHKESGVGLIPGGATFPPHVHKVPVPEQPTTGEIVSEILALAPPATTAVSVFQFVIDSRIDPGATFGGLAILGVPFARAVDELREKYNLSESSMRVRESQSGRWLGWLWGHIKGLVPPSGR